MKYMGSKRWMLGNGLGQLLLRRALDAERFVDLFSGTATVSWHVATNVKVPVLAVDLQSYSSVLAKAVVGRTRKVDSEALLTEWVEKATIERSQCTHWTRAIAFQGPSVERGDVEKARALCLEQETLITRCYGGYYFSPEQALTADALLSVLPKTEPNRSVCLSALIWAMARCVASPGHTAQPFQPTTGALSFLREAWSKDLIQVINETLPGIAEKHALTVGKTIVGDAMVVAKNEISAGDLVFVDPPYSAAQYSRFYHVLETAARGYCGEVSGGGRYPPFSERPRSSFSLVSEAKAAIADLLSTLGEAGCGVVMTFPQHSCSNGISGEYVIGLARRWFEVDITSVNAHHSTLGGNNTGRTARRRSIELILSLRPR